MAMGWMRAARPLAGVILVGMSGVAAAHVDGDAHAHGWIGGLGHPFSGFDHWLAMLAVGLWADQLAQSREPRTRMWIPSAFVMCMGFGALLAWRGTYLPSVESSIAASVLVLGLLLATRARAPFVLALPITASFALVHGYAHGAEAGGASMGFFAGMMLATAALHALGIALSRALRAWRAEATWPARTLGAGIAASGLSLLALA